MSKQTDTEAIRERAMAAGRGPWTAVDCNLGFGNAYVIAENESGAVVGVCHDVDPADAVFIAEARTDVLVLCDEVEYLRHAKRTSEQDAHTALLHALEENQRLRNKITKMTGTGSLDLEPIRQRARAAAPGPWTRGHDVHCECEEGSPRCVHEFDVQAIVLPPLGCAGPVAIVGQVDGDNASFIAHGRQDIDHLCDEVERVRAQAKHWKAKYDALDAELSEGVDECEG